MTRLYKNNSTVLSVALLICLTACTTTIPAEKASASDYEKLSDQPNTHDDQATLYQNIILGRIAVGRQQISVASKYYIAALEIKFNIDLANEALLLTEQLNNQQDSLKIANLWLTKFPDALMPRKLITYYAFMTTKPNKQLESATVNLEKVISTEQNTVQLLLFLNRLARKHNQAEVYQQYILSIYLSLAEKHPTNTALSLAIATLYQNQKAWPKALALTFAVSQQQPKLKLGWELHGTLLIASGAKKEALDWYRQTAEQFPLDKTIRHNYGQLLYELDKYSDAREQFELILKHSPEDSDSQYMIGAIYYSEKNFNKSREYFEPLLRFRHHRNPVLFYLGEMARVEKKTQVAIKLYQQISPSRYFASGHINIARLLRVEGKEQQAIDYLKELSVEDNDINFRYMRAMIAADMDEIDLAESDLRHILTLNPNHLDAVNALGYTLADANKNLDEALSLIERAYQSNPNSAAVIDSMGWIYYRLGSLAKAVGFLQQAYDIEPNDEIAAHLGEVLWLHDKKQIARKVLNAAIKKAPDSKALINTIEKFNIKISKNSTES